MNRHGRAIGKKPASDLRSHYQKMVTLVEQLQSAAPLLGGRVFRTSRGDRDD